MTQTYGTAEVEAAAELAAEPPAEPGPDPETAVRALLAMAHLTPAEDEVAGLVEGFRAARAAVRLLYAVPEARYDEPAVLFSARA
ncbi:hypothetical protein [Modestobacter sp. SSW1-42]|uniref:hypothetical protein n=1 Tax=Modestobacter sp. SSW1-42 TaxID=596372 RepID=UPI003985BCC6